MTITEALVAEHNTFLIVFDQIERVLPGLVTPTELRTMAGIVERLLESHAKTEANLAYLALDHVLASPRPSGPGIEDVALAGLGPDRTFIRILAVPGLKRNCHTIEVEGEFGALKVEVQNVPTENPKTGRLTAMSILRAIEDAVDPVRIGG